MKVIITIPRETPTRNIDAFSFLAVDFAVEKFGEDTEVEILPEAPLSIAFDADETSAAEGAAASAARSHLMHELYTLLESAIDIEE